MQTVQEAYTTHKGNIQSQVASIGDIIGISMPNDTTDDLGKQPFYQEMG